MANMCMTNIRIVGQTKEETKAFYEKLEEWLGRQYAANGFDENCSSHYHHCWLGNIVGNSGIDQIGPDGDFEKYNCRGTVEFIEYNEDRGISIDAETAWAPRMLMWKALVDQYLPGAEIYYSGIETGNGVFCTNEEYQIGKFVIDVIDDSSQYSNFMKYEIDYEAESETVKEVFQEALVDAEAQGIALTESELQEKLQKENWFEELEPYFLKSVASEFLSISKWENVPIEELN